MIQRCVAVTLYILAAVLSHAQPSLPSSFQAKTIHSPAGAEIFVRWGGSGPVVVLIHGYAENSDSWAPLAADLMKDHTVVVPDLRGIGRSSKPADGYDKKTQAKDMRAVVTSLGYDKTFVVAHDIGNMVAYAYAATYPDKVERLVVMDAPIPGIDPWSEILQNPGVWHFNFHGPDAERLVAGRERIYFDRIWNDFTGDPSKPDEATRNFFAATYAQPGGMRAGFAQFAAFSQDAKDNKVFEQTKLTMPVLAVGGEKSFGPLQAVIMRHVATNVQEEVVAGSGHWLMEERPAYTVALIRKFLDGPASAPTPTAATEIHPQYVGAVSINPCQDPKILADWYSKLGLETHEVSGGFYGTFKTPAGPLFFGIHPKRNDAPKTSSASVSVVFRIDDYDRYIAEVGKRGLTPIKVEQDSTGRFAHFKDPDGNEVTLWGN